MFVFDCHLVPTTKSWNHHKPQTRNSDLGLVCLFASGYNIYKSQDAAAKSFQSFASVIVHLSLLLLLKEHGHGCMEYPMYAFVFRLDMRVCECSLASEQVCIHVCAVSI